MKTYKTIQDWLATNPSKNSSEKILQAINRNVKTEGLKLINVKQKALKELSTVRSKMESLQSPRLQEI